MTMNSKRPKQKYIYINLNYYTSPRQVQRSLSMWQHGIRECSILIKKVRQPQTLPLCFGKIAKSFLQSLLLV